MNSSPPVFSVSEISQRLKALVESQMGFIHARGELSEVKRAASGHVYATLKDREAVLNAIIWRSNMERLTVRPEDGIEVIATGRMTTYPGRSNYQLVIEKLEMAGEGALLKLIEERRKKLAAEGLFDESRKRSLPRYPQKIAVVTSPTGAVIKDILHRLEERYPCEVHLWTVLVQGEGAARQIADALHKIATLQMLPDLVIVARGGGSLEDLMAFNDEAVIRAAAACPVPLISAVGHETDTTLLDWVADRRAPTPTAAAEMATPERFTLRAALRETAHVLTRSLVRLYENKGQRLDQTAGKLLQCLAMRLGHHRLKLAALSLRSPQENLAHRKDRLSVVSSRLMISIRTRHDKKAQTLESLARVLRNVSFETVLDRGFALVRDEKGHAITDAANVKKGDVIQVQFAHNVAKKAEIL